MWSRTAHYPSLTGDAEAVQSGAGAVFDDDAIKTSVATSTDAEEYLVAALDGVIGGALMSPRRGVTVTTGAAVGAYNTGAQGIIRVTGEIDLHGGESLEVFAEVQLTEADGGETLDFPFPAGLDRVTKINVAAMADTDGTLEFGVGDIFARFDKELGAKRRRQPFAGIVGLATGNVAVGYSDGNVDILPVVAGRLWEVNCTKIFRVGTTAIFSVGFP